MPDLVAACSWSSGKDSCLALYKAIQDGYNVKHLFNFVSREYKRVSFHGAPAALVRLQAEAIGIPLLQKETTQNTYEEVFRETLRGLREEGIDRVVRGDIHLQDLRDWVENICHNEGISVVLPLWKKDAEGLLKEFIECEFKAVVTSIQANKLKPYWLGRIVDKRFVTQLKELREVDLCGENGEFHTFVYDGPIFNKRINITRTDKVLINGYWFLDIQEYKLEGKGGEQ